MDAAQAVPLKMDILALLEAPIQLRYVRISVEISLSSKQQIAIVMMLLHAQVEMVAATIVLLKVDGHALPVLKLQHQFVQITVEITR